MPSPYQIFQDREGRMRTENSRERLIWETESGTFRGWEDRLVLRAQGIRYAMSRRFCPPESFSYGEEVSGACSPAPVPAQNRSPVEEFLTGINYEELPQDEFAQYLSIALPKGTKGREKLPVMVWIPGGAFRNGGIDIRPYNTELPVYEQHVIMVSLQYRLGAFGFLRDGHGDPANPGLLDLIEGLRWIRKNIANFGGDPDNVTLVGQSAGACAALCLMISEGAEGLFRRVIIQSCPFGTLKGRAEVEKEMLLSFRDVRDDAPAEEFLRKQAEAGASCHEKGNARYMLFAPRYGVPPLPREEEAGAAWAAACRRTDVLIGSNQREAAPYLGLHKPLLFLARLPFLRNAAEYVIGKKSRELFIDGTEEFFSRYSGRHAGMYCYRLTWGLKDGIFGAGHAIELSLLFGSHLYEGSPLLMKKDEADRCGRQLRQLWAGFAGTGKISTTAIKDVLKMRRG